MVRYCSCLIVNCPTGYGVGGRGCCKGEIKDGGACSIPVVVCRNVFFIDQLQVVHVGPVDDRICAFGCLNLGVPPRMMGIEVTHSNGFFRKGDLTDASFDRAFIVVRCL